MPFTSTWMQLEILMLSEVIQKEKNKYHMISLIHGISNMAQMNLSAKQKHTDIENIIVVAKGEGGEGAG